MISDADEANLVLTDDQINGFIGAAELRFVEASAVVYAASSLALRAIAVNEVLVQKRIKSLDLSTDGPAEARELRELADDYDEQAQQIEMAGSSLFDVIVPSAC